MNRRTESGSRLRPRHGRVFDRTQMRHRLKAAARRGDPEKEATTAAEPVAEPAAEAVPVPPPPAKPARKPRARRTGQKAATTPTVAKDGDRMEAPAAETAAPEDPWSKARDLAAKRIDLLTTAECLRLLTRHAHPSTLVYEITPCPEVAEFKTISGGDTLFVMGARTQEITPGVNGSSVAMICGVISSYNDHVGIHAIDPCHWDKGERHDLPALVPLSEMEARFRQNPYAMSVSIEGLAGVQLERTDITMRDVLDGFMLAHRGLTPNEINRRYDWHTARRITAIMSLVGAHTTVEEGRNLDWHGWADVPVDRQRKREKEGGRSLKDVHERHARGRYGSGDRLALEEEYLDIQVVEGAEARETVHLLRRALNAVNLPMEAEQRILEAIETLTVPRGKVYDNHG